MSPADELATAIVNGMYGASIGLALWVAGMLFVAATRWIWTRYFWPPIEDQRMLAERREL